MHFPQNFKTLMFNALTHPLHASFIHARGWPNGLSRPFLRANASSTLTVPLLATHARPFPVTRRAVEGEIVDDSFNRCVLGVVILNVVYGVGVGFGGVGFGGIRVLVFVRACCARTPRHASPMGVVELGQVLSQQMRQLLSWSGAD